MSLSWRDRLYIVLAPSRIDLMRVAGLLRRSATFAEVVPGVEVMAQAPWRASVQALAQAIPGLASRGMRCDVVLSNHFCRYTVIPGTPGLADGREMEAYARLKFDEVFGAGAADRWEVRLGRAASGEPRLACAVDRELMEELRRVCSASRVKLATVRPLLAASFDHSRARLRSGDFWFAAAEEGRLCLAAVQNRAWRSVASQRIGRNLVEELRAMLDRALVSAPGMTADSVYLFSREHQGERARALPGVTVLPLSRADDAADAHEIARGRVFA